MAKFKDFLKKENVAENTSAGGMGAGSIASTAGALGNKPKKRKRPNKEMPKETIFAMSNEEQGDDTDRDPDPVKDRHWKGNRKLNRVKKRKIGPNDTEEKLKDEINVIRKRAGITEASPLLMTLLSILKIYKEGFEKGGEQLARQTLLNKGLDEGMVEAIARIYQEQVG